jgi:ribulose-phosphate 3-epimerase
VSRTAFETLKAAAPTLSVGILSADLLALGSALALVEAAGAALVHVDVMDGCFCPALTVGPPFIKALRTPLLKDVHLMVDAPLAKVPDVVAAGADVVTVHVEADRHIHRVLQALGRFENANDPARGLVRGVALNPGTPVETIVPLLDEIDLVLVLAVNPGWSGQRFIPATFDRLARVKAIVADAGRDILVGVDGGITRANLDEVARTGVDLIVAGSAVFEGGAPAEHLRAMLQALGPR